MFIFLRTQLVVLTKEKLQIRRNFYLPWSDSPTMTLTELTCNRDKCQRKATKQGVIVNNEDKGSHFVDCAQDSGLFEAEWVEKWEVTTNRT